jgi:hypothetical protein
MAAGLVTEALDSIAELSDAAAPLLQLAVYVISRKH